MSGDVIADSATDATASKAVARDGAALGGSAMLTAVAGLVGWLIAARLLPQAAIGRSASFVNGFILVASVSELALGPGMLRWLPRAGRRSMELIGRCYAAALATAVVVSVVWSLLYRESLAAAVAPWPPMLAVLSFVLAGASWVTFHLEDEALTGLGWARWVPVENGIFAVVRIALLVLLAPRLGALGIIVSWLLPTLVLVIVVNSLLIAAHRRVDRGPSVLPSRAEVWRLTAPAYPAQVATAVSASFVQIIVTSRLGPEVGAVFFVVWTGVNALDVALTGFGNSLVVGLGTTRTGRLRLVRGSVLRIFALELPALAIAFLLAPWLLALFGPGYVAGTAMMRWVLVGFLCRTVVILTCSIHLAFGRTVRLAVLQVATALALLAVASVGHSLTFFGIAFVVVQATIALVAAIDLALALRKESAHA